MGWCTHNIQVMCCRIVSLCNFIKQCHPSKFNKKYWRVHLFDLGKNSERRNLSYSHFLITSSLRATDLLCSHLRFWSLPCSFVRSDCDSDLRARQRRFRPTGSLETRASCHASSSYTWDVFLPF